MKYKKHKLPIFLALLIIMYSCASMGTPDGGPYDEEPPRFLKSHPKPFATNVKSQKFSIEFDEIVKLEKAYEKVMVSPPQMEQPDIKAVGRKIVGTLMDTLKPNMTYTVDFSDAIVDNNEGNPLGNFAYVFSTGETIDTMEVSGTVLNASNLEPVKNMLVGLHASMDDSVFTTKPFERLSRTDSRGRFTIRGLNAGKYRVFALMDGNQNYFYDSKTEAIAFLDSLIVPTCEASVRQDTLRKDSVTIDTIKTVKYTRFMPDNLVLRAFKAENDRQYLRDAKRDQLNHFILKFSAKADTLPTIKGLNFDEKNTLIVEANDRNDSICYWITDSLLCEQDTLEIQMDYMATDTLDNLVARTDTLQLINNNTREDRLKKLKDAQEKKEKQRKRLEKKGKKLPPEPTRFFEMNVHAPSDFDLNKNIEISFKEPVSHIDTAAFHLETMVDSLWQKIPFVFQKDTLLYRKYILLAAWEPEKKYRLQIDSLAVKGVYGLSTDKVSKEFKVKKVEDYGTLLLDIKGVDKYGIVELMDSKETIIARQAVTPEHTADFYYIPSGSKYYIRMFVDRNQNGKWDTGDYDKKIQPEEIYYFPKLWEMKANFSFEETWDVHATPLDRQKLTELKKQKPDEQKKVKNRNAERAKKMKR